MNTIQTEVEITAEGTLKLLSPLPAGLKPGRAQIMVILKDDSEQPAKPKRKAPTATPEMLAIRKKAYAELRALGGLRDVIPDPVAWQRESREDVVLPGRS
jgi:hypothetical protein